MLTEAVFCLDLKCSDVDGAIGELLGLLEGSFAVGEEAALLEELLRRERLRKAAGEGEFALLHAFASSLKSSRLAFGRSAAGLLSEGSDSPAVHFVCLVLIPPGESQRGFSCLNGLAVLLREPMVRTQMLWAETQEEVLTLCRESEGARGRAAASWLKARLEGLLKPSAAASRAGREGA